MARSKSLQDASQPENRPYHQLNRSVTVLNRILQISCGPMAQMSPGKGQPTERCKQTNGATVPPALRSFACKPIFRSVRPYFFLFQHVCAIRMPGSEGFRLGNLSRQRIVGVLGTLLFQIFALENLFACRDRRNWSSVPIESQRNVVPCRYQSVFFFKKHDRLGPRRGPQSVFLTFINLFLF